MNTNIQTRPPQAGEPPTEAGDDSRTQLQSESRHRIVAKIIETMKRHIPFDGPEGLREIERIAVTFEENMYVGASSQSDYLRKISLKMLTMETKSQTAVSHASLDPVLMDGNNQRPPEGEQPSMETGDWRSQLQLDSRRRIVAKIIETLKRHLPFNGEEGLRELVKIAVRFEEKIYVAASSQSDYLRKISMKMLTMENRPQGGETSMVTSNWRSQLQPDSRYRIIAKITEVLKRHLPFNGEEGLRELERIAVRFEEKIFTVALSQSDYLRKISLKMLTMESKSQTAASATPPLNLKRRRVFA